MVPVPLPLSVKVTPAGSVVGSIKSVVFAGNPGVVVTVKLPGRPTVKVAVLGLVIVGARSMISVNAWTAAGATPLLAVRVSWKLPVAVGVPLITAVPSLSGVKVRPLGNWKLGENVATGKPAVLTTKLFCWLTAK